jgi:hypothetical protein
MKQRALLIVGMHRSGTSAVARMLNLLGAEISENLLPAGIGNELGHWEQAEVLTLHDEMLTSAGSSWDDLLGLKPSWFRSTAAQDYGKALAELIQSRFGSAPLFVVKDPRIGLFIPVWIAALSMLNVEPRFVLPFRRPLEVELSLKARHKLAWDSEWPTGQGELLWLRYVLAAEKMTRGYPRSFVLFDALLNNWRAEAKRIASQLKLDWPRQSRTVKLAIDRFLDAKHKHENIGAGHSAHEEASAWFARVFNQLLVCVDDPRTGAEVFDCAELALSDASHLFANYVRFFRNPMQVAQLDTELKRIGSALEEARAAVTSRDQALAQGTQDLAARDQALAQAAHDLVARDQALAQAANDLAARDRILEETKQVVISRNRALVDLGHALAEAEALAKTHEENASNYWASLRAIEESARAIETSTTWRLASPLRTVLTRHPDLARFGRRSLKLAWWTITRQLRSKLREQRRVLSHSAAAQHTFPVLPNGTTN